MKPILATILRRAFVSGSVAGVLSASVAAARARGDGSTVYAPINAVTHCIWPRRAFAETGFSARHTLTGFAIHHASAVFWALLFESMLLRRPPLEDADGDNDGGPARYAPDAADAPASPAAIVASAGATAAIAYAIDYHAVPERLTPGFDAHLSKRSLFYVYAGLAAGLALAALSRRD